MKIILGRTASDPRYLDKSVEQVKEMSSAHIKENTSIVNPVFIIDYPGTVDFNYVTVASWGRKYFVKDITALTGDRLAVSCHVDVLSSFAGEIRNCEAIINKQQEDPKTSPYINDGSYVTLCKDVIQCYTFPQGFSACSNIFITAGGN